MMRKKIIVALLLSAILPSYLYSSEQLRGISFFSPRSQDMNAARDIVGWHPFIHRPDAQKNYVLFLYSEGYYLEWMREHWIKDKDLLKLKQIVEDPSKYLRAETKNYKIYEKNLEADFWNSKIDTKTFSYYEN